MKIIELPVYNDDGSIKATLQINPDEAQVLLQFALNFLTATGMSLEMVMKQKRETEAASSSDLSQLELKFND